MNQKVIFPNTGYIPLVVDRIHEESKNFKSFTFREGHPIHYEAGQFITLVDHNRKHGNESPSIISSSVLQEPLTIAVKRIDNGFFSRKLVDRTRPGDTLYSTGAAGFFRLPQNIKTITGIFFFAAGSGIAPVLSLLNTVLHLYPDIRVFLIYSNPSPASTAFYPELKRMEQEFPNQLHIDFLFSSESDLRRARLNRDLLLEFLTTNRFDREKLFFIPGARNPICA